MDINTLRGISTLVVMIAFVGIVVWVYFVKSKSDFDEAANQPFADEAVNENEDEDASEDLQ